MFKNNAVGKIVKKLDEYAALIDALEALRLDLEARVQGLIPVDVQVAINDLTAEVAPKIEFAEARLESLKAEIAEATIKAGATVPGEHYQAIFSNGRVTWKTKELDGWAVSNPAVLAFRKQGDPYVTIQERKTNHG